jgi:hypothetical protein
MRHGFHFGERGGFCIGPHSLLLEQVRQVRTGLQKLILEQLILQPLTCLEQLTSALQSETVRPDIRLGWAV